LNLTRTRALWILAVITAAGGALRFYNLAWGAPYYHFHIDEHFVLNPADMMRRDMRETAMSGKFFMYSPLLMYLINIVRTVYEAVSHPLNLAVPRDQITYMVLGRSISAAFGTATIPLVYAVGARVSGRLAGLLSAAFLAFAVLHVRDSHFASTDISMVFFTVLALWCALRLVERGDLGWLVASGIAVACAAVSKYTGAFVLGVVGVAYLLSPRRPATLRPLTAWGFWALRGTIPIVVAVVTFFILDPLVLMYPDKFLFDVKEQITDPLRGLTRPMFMAQFADLKHPRLYWFTNLLWWGLGPALEILGLAGVVWLLARRDKRAAVLAAFPIIYFLTAGRTVAPMIRYSIPLAPALAMTAGTFGADWLSRRRLRAVAAVVVGIAVLTTALYALAYMNIFRQPDARVEASRWLVRNVPANAKILVEPSQNTPPMGSYFTKTNFHRDYVNWGGRTRAEAERERHDYYRLYTLDTYVYLIADRHEDDEKRRYISSQLARVDWIVIDDTYVQWYQHLEAANPAGNAVVAQHYRDLFDGKLGFELVQTFKVYPALSRWRIIDDAAEFTFRLFDHPTVFIFKRAAPAA
jgi:hypothetical protein